MAEVRSRKLIPAKHRERSSAEDVRCVDCETSDDWSNIGKIVASRESTAMVAHRREGIFDPK